MQTEMYMREIRISIRRKEKAFSLIQSFQKALFLTMNPKYEMKILRRKETDQGSISQKRSENWAKNKLHGKNNYAAIGIKYEGRYFEISL